MEISRGNCITLNLSRADRRRENFSSGKNYLLPGHLPRLIV